MATTTDEQAESATYSAIKFAGLAGVLSAALGVAGVIVDEMWTIPGTGATAGEIAGFVDTHRSALLIALVLTTIGVSLWLVFGVGVWLSMRATAREESFLAACFPLGSSASSRYCSPASRPAWCSSIAHPRHPTLGCSTTSRSACSRCPEFLPRWRSARTRHRSFATAVCLAGRRGSPSQPRWRTLRCSRRS